MEAYQNHNDYPHNVPTLGVGVVGSGGSLKPTVMLSHMLSVVSILITINYATVPVKARHSSSE